MIETGTLLHERFLIEEQVGVGGMGAVYRAVDQKFGSAVAVKETFYNDPELADAFEREARLLNGLHHPIFPHVSDHFTENEGHFLVMEYIEGEDLSELIKRGERFPFDTVMGWTLDLLDGLDYLHSQDPPIIHRDIKPSNLKLTSRGNIVLLDFGMAKETSGNTQGMRSVFGYSRRYSPLEQIEGTGTDVRSDIFSLGATVFHLLTGTPPVDVLRRASAIVAGRPDPLELASKIEERIPERVALIVNSALALNPDGRFISARAMWNALEHSLTGLQSPSAASFVPVAAPATVAEPIAESGIPVLEAFEAQPESGDETPPAATAFQSAIEDEFDQSAAPAAHQLSEIRTADAGPGIEEAAQTDRILVPVYGAAAPMDEVEIQDLGVVDDTSVDVTDETQPMATAVSSVGQRPMPAASRHNNLVLFGIPLLLLILGLTGYALFHNSSSDATVQDVSADRNEPPPNEPDASVLPAEPQGPDENVMAEAEMETTTDSENSEAFRPDSSKAREVLEPTGERKVSPSNDRLATAKGNSEVPRSRAKNEAPAVSGTRAAARPRIVQNDSDERPPVSSIESIMTGIPTNRPRRQNSQWEVWQEDQLRRERRQRRINRRNRQNWPLY